jgi:hypothetical protein
VHSSRTVHKVDESDERKDEWDELILSVLQILDMPTDLLYFHLTLEMGFELYK